MRFKRQPGSGTLADLRPLPDAIAYTPERMTAALDSIERACVAARLHVNDMAATDLVTRQAGRESALRMIAQITGAAHSLMYGQPSKVAQAYARGEKVVR